MTRRELLSSLLVSGATSTALFSAETAVSPAFPGTAFHAYPTLRRWRLEKRGPTFLKVGSLVRYRPEDLDSWVAALPIGGDRTSNAIVVMTTPAAI